MCSPADQQSASGSHAATAGTSGWGSPPALEQNGFTPPKDLPVSVSYNRRRRSFTRHRIATPDPDCPPVHAAEASVRDESERVDSPSACFAHRPSVASSPLECNGGGRLLLSEDDDRRVWENVPLRVLESRDPDGALRVALEGELDLAVADRLAVRLEQLRRDWIPVRLDLSRLEFTDSSGIRVLVEATKNGSEDGRRLLEICPEVTPGVLKVIDLVGVGPVLRPAPDSVK